VQAIVGDKLAPGLLDRYLARTAYDAQQRDEPASPDRPENLFGAVPGEFAAHGRFDQTARTTSVQLWLTRHRRWLGAGAATALAAVWASRRRA
jgi:hypothetical protein